MGHFLYSSHAVNRKNRPDNPYGFHNTDLIQRGKEDIFRGITYDTMTLADSSYAPAILCRGLAIYLDL